MVQACYADSKECRSEETMGLQGGPRKDLGGPQGQCRRWRG